MRHGVLNGIAICLTILALSLATGCGSVGTPPVDLLGPSESGPAGVYGGLLPKAEELWSAPVPRDPGCGNLESIHLLDDTLVLLSSKNHVIALDDKGMTKWVFTRMELPPEFPPVIGPTAVAFITRDKLWVVDRETGKLLNGKTLSFTPSAPPALSRSTVYIPSLSDNRIYAISIDDGTEGWRVRLGAPISAAPVMGGSIGRPILIVATEGGQVLAFDALAATAPAPEKPHWQVSLPDGVYADLTLSADRSVVYVSSEDYSLYAINVSTGDKEWTYPAGRPLDTSAFEVRNSPEDPGMVFQKNANDLIAIDTASGNVKWTIPGAMKPMCKWGDQYLIIGPGNTIRRISSVDGSEAASAGVGDYFLICDYRGGRFILADQAWNMKVLRYRKY